MSDILPIDPAEIVEEPPMPALVPPTMAPNASIGEIRVSKDGGGRRSGKRKKNNI